MTLRKIYSLFVAAILLAGFSNSCKKTSTSAPPEPVVPSGQSAKGVIRGHVQTYDQYGNPNTGSSPAIHLSIAGGYTAVTDDSGDFHIDSVPSGTYTILLSGEGIASTLARNVHLVKDSCFKSLAVSKIPDFELTSIFAYNMASVAQLQLSVRLLEDTRARNVLVFLSKRPLPTTDWPEGYLMAVEIPISGGTFGKSTFISVPELNRNGIFYGDTVYVAAAPYLVNDASAYIDSKTGKTVYTGIGNLILDTVVAP